MNNLRKELVTIFLEEDRIKDLISPLVKTYAKVHSNEGLSEEKVLKAVKDQFNIDELIEKFSERIDPKLTDSELEEIIGYYKSTALKKFLHSHEELFKEIYSPFQKIVIDLAKTL